MTRVVVTGSRTWPDRERIAKVLTAYGKGRGEISLAHGGARGVDQMAAEIAEELGWSIEEYPARWDEEGRAAGVKRNVRMLAAHKPHVVIAFPHGEARGTRHCMKAARKMNIPVIEVLYEPASL